VPAVTSIQDGVIGRRGKWSEARSAVPCRMIEHRSTHRLITTQLVQFDAAYKVARPRNSGRVVPSPLSVTVQDADGAGWERTTTLRVSGDAA